MRTEAGELFILDIGSGACGLGASLMASSPPSQQGHILVSHLHWDHIQGLPFFAPLYAPDGLWNIYAPKPLEGTAREAFAIQMSPPFFPITLDQLTARLHFHDLQEGTFQIGGATVTTRSLNHPGPTLGYRIEADGVALVYACDHEPCGNEVSTSCQILDPRDYAHAKFLADADLVIHDAQYNAGEFSLKRGWGHSVGEYVVELCRLGRVKHVVLTHHDPMRTDLIIDESLEQLRRGFADRIGLPRVSAAAEGAVINLGVAHGSG
ncbi:MBL fold metallo-hydrolase [Cyanobium sp. CH-040]|nr:MBL fold metallo-hydrolase [Cyanobium sp. CH-040]MCP9928612.1 MBL fold metallo-hydrolase [Cyanobium sp. CH-040]